MKHDPLALDRLPQRRVHLIQAHEVDPDQRRRILDQLGQPRAIGNARPGRIDRKIDVRARPVIAPGPRSEQHHALHHRQLGQLHDEPGDRRMSHRNADLDMRRATMAGTSHRQGQP
jgi:hypothetical protein